MRKKTIFIIVFASVCMFVSGVVVTKFYIDKKAESAVKLSDNSLQNMSIKKSKILENKEEILERIEKLGVELGQDLTEFRQRQKPLTTKDLTMLEEKSKTLLQMVCDDIAKISVREPASAGNKLSKIDNGTVGKVIKNLR